MRTLQKKFLVTILFVFSCSIFLGNIAANAVAAKPKLQKISEPAAEYLKEEGISIFVNCPNYTGKVEYMTILVDKSTNKMTTIWNYGDIAQYSKGQLPIGNQKFVVNLSTHNVQPGYYSIKILVRKAGTKVSYDSSVETKIFKIKPTAQIVSVDDINASVEQYDDYTFPKYVTAKFDNGNQDSVIVNWESTNVDTSTAGDYAIKGRAKEYDKEISLNIKVTPITPNNEGNNNGNIQQNGSLASQGDWIYYQHDTMYKMKKDGTRKTPVDNQIYGKYLNVIGNIIYYTDHNDYLYRMTTSGLNKVKLTDKPVDCVKVVGNWVYYQEFFKDEATGNSMSIGPVYRMKTDGTNKVQMADNVKSFVVDGDWIYYISRDDGRVDAITKIKTDGSNKQVIITGSLLQFNVSDGWVYYADLEQNGALYKVTVDGTQKQCLSQNKYADNINFVDDYIYFTEGGDLNFGYLFKMKKDGTNKAQLTNYQVRLVNITGGYIKFQSQSDASQLNLYKLDAIK